MEHKFENAKTSTTLDELIVEHSDGKIKLLDGSILQGYTPQRVVYEQVKNGMELDATGEYLSVGSAKPQPKKHPTPEEQGKFFIEHAFFFLAHRREIMADSRMFLARVNVPNGVAYTGRSGFREATLGVYLEWWASCAKAVYEKDGHKWLVWFISGSPLSGCNSCGAVNEEGKSKTVKIYPFWELWTPFVRINRRYDEVKSKYVAFTLEEVVNILRGSEEDKEKRGIMLDNFFLRSANSLLCKKLAKAEEDRDEKHRKLVETTIKLYISDYSTLYNRYVSEKALIDQERDALYVQRKELRRQLKAGELDGKTYQNTVRSINKALQHSFLGAFYHLADELEKRQTVVTVQDVILYFEKHPRKLKVENGK